MGANLQIRYRSRVLRFVLPLLSFDTFTVIVRYEMVLNYNLVLSVMSVVYVLHQSTKVYLPRSRTLFNKQLFSLKIFQTYQLLFCDKYSIHL